MNGLRYLRREEIDTQRWDACVLSSPQSRIYGSSEFLDKMADSWAGIVWNDYQAVLPLPRRRKYGINYLCPMPFSGPLAVYTSSLESPDTLAFLEQIPAEFRLWDLNLEVEGRSLPWPIIARRNHVLRLDRPYTDIAAAYRSSLKQSLAGAASSGSYMQAGIPIDLLLDTATASKALQGTRVMDRHRLKALYETLRQRERAFTLGWIQDGLPLAGALFFRSARRVYYIAAWSGEAGRRCGAAARLLDAVIQEYAGRDMVLDFEGSDIPGLAFFFESFGAVSEPYHLVKRRRFPFF